MVNITTVAFSDSRGGAARAALQQVRAIRELDDVFVNFVVAEKKLDGPLSLGPSKLRGFWHFCLRVISYAISKLQFSDRGVKRSLNIFSSSHVINNIQPNAGCIHLHWFNNETLSLRALKKLLSTASCTVVITLHDEWLFAGSEHCINSSNNRYLLGYNKENSNVRGIDLDRWVYTRKLSLKKLLEKENVILTLPSNYMLHKAKSSFLLQGADIYRVPNIIDCDKFTPSSQKASRDHFNLPSSGLMLSFGAIGGGSYLKGSDLLLKSLEYLRVNFPELKFSLLTFGGNDSGERELYGYNVINLGHISSSKTLSLVYSAADVVIVPSRVESFGQVAAESLACETPVIAFDNSGLTDIVQHESSGLLVPAFDTASLGLAIYKMLNLSQEERNIMGRNGRRFVQKTFSPSVVTESWKGIYNIK